MDAELKTYLQQMEGRMNARFERIDARFERIDARLDSIDARFDALERQFRDALEATETKLLTEFWKWARTLDAKLRRLEASDAATAERLTILEERVFTLERKVEGSKE